MIVDTNIRPSYISISDPGLPSPTLASLKFLHEHPNVPAQQAFFYTVLYIPQWRSFV